jgi:hypothetical protein
VLPGYPFLCLQDVTWALQVQKTGTDTVYQGAVTGQITITNPQATPVTVYGINSYVQGGPSSTVSCGTQMPFQVRVPYIKPKGRVGAEQHGEAYGCSSTLAAECVGSASEPAYKPACDAQKDSAL